MLVVWCGAISGAVLLICLSRISLSALTQLANQLAPGRMAVNFLSSEACRSDAATKEWTTRAGSLILGFERDENQQTTDDNMAAISQKSPVKETQKLDRADDLRMVVVADASDSRASMPVSAILALRKGLGSPILL